MLLSDHVTEKSATVQWVDVSMPQKRSHRLKDHKGIELTAKLNPDNEDIHEDNLGHILLRDQRLSGQL